MNKKEIKIMKLEMSIISQKFKASIAYNKFKCEQGKVTQLEYRLEQFKNKQS